MTTSQKFKYKAEGYGKQWDPTTSITAYFTSLDKFRTSLADHGRDKHQGDDDGSRRKNVGEQDVQ